MTTKTNKTTNERNTMTDDVVRALTRALTTHSPPPPPDTATWAGDECENLAAGLAAAFAADAPAPDPLADGLRRVFASETGPGGGLERPPDLTAAIRSALTDPTIPTPDK